MIEELRTPPNTNVPLVSIAIFSACEEPSAFSLSSPTRPSLRRRPSTAFEAEYQSRLRWDRRFFLPLHLLLRVPPFPSSDDALRDSSLPYSTYYGWEERTRGRLESDVRFSLGCLRKTLLGSPGVQSVGTLLAQRSWNL